MTRIPVLITAFLGFGVSVAQTTEDFEDETLGNTPDLFSPTWSGNTSLFILVDEGGDKQLRSNAGDLSSSMDYNITVPSTDISDFTWEFLIDLKFNPSGANYVDVFLASDNADLSAVQNGYYVRIGDTEDWIALHKIVGGTRTDDSSPLISTAEDILNSTSSKPYKIRVVRDGSGNWELFTDEDVTGSFVSEGTIMDTDVTTSSHFGIFIQQSSASSPADNHFFDDVSITSNSTPDTDPPIIQSVTTISDTGVDVTFNENVDQTTAEMSTNYSIDGGLSVLSAALDWTNNALVHVTTSSMTNGTAYTITISNIEDESGNVIASNSQDNYQYLVFEEAVEFDVVINEFMADPNPVIALPDAEYVELYNRSGKFFDLENWQLDGQSLGTYQFDPDSYVIVCDDDDLALFSTFSNVLTVATLTLSNSNMDVITIEDDNSTMIHSISFEGSTGGTSSELINPNGPDYSQNNYGFSIDADGGTPGEQNSIFDDTPDTTQPTISTISVITATILSVTFDEPVDESTAETIANYSADGDIIVNAAMRDDDDNSVVHLTVSALISGDTRTLTINNVEDLSGNVIAANSAIDFEYIETREAFAGDVLVNEFHAIPNDESGIPNAEFIELLNVSSKFIDLENWTFSDVSGDSGPFPSHILRPTEYVILTASRDGALFYQFGDVLEVPSFRSLNNSGDAITITDSNEVDIYSITYTTARSGVSTELINPTNPDFSENNYGFSIDPDGGTPGEQNSILDDTPDTTGPMIWSVSLISATSLDVTFGESVDETTAERAGNYSIDGGITIDGAMRDDVDNSIVHLTVSTLISGATQTLTINNVEDLSGNTITSNSTIDFEYIETQLAVAGDVVVNEFYAIPNDESGIPNAEFVELLNVSSKFIDLGNWTLSDVHTTSSGFSSHLLRPNAYVLLVPSGQGNSFSVFGDVVEVSSFPSLNNNGDAITITDSGTVDIYSISYTSASSGVSTELINSNGPDFSENNYGLSTDPDGGTPGEQNSIFDDTPDTTQPTISSISVVSATALDVTFDEPVAETSAETTGNYSIGGGIMVIGAMRDDGNNSVVHLTVSMLVSGDTRTLTIDNVEDLSGNAIVANSTIDFEYIETEKAVAGDVLVNEFHAIPTDESGIPNVEFIELLNVSSKFIDLAGWTWSDGSTTSSSFGSYVLRPNEYVILVPSGTSSSFVNFGDVVEVAGFPSLNNRGDAITITNGSMVEIYSITFTTASLGVSTELINPDGPDFSEYNYGLSTDPDGGTPGEQNSIFDNTPNTIRPTISDLAVVSSTQLRLIFSEQVTPVSSQNVLNYSVDGGITVTSAILDAENSTVVNLIVSELISTEVRVLSVSNVQDLSGNQIETGTTVDFVFIATQNAMPGDVLVNEYMANPLNEGEVNGEFIEILNNTANYLELENWTVSDASGSSGDFPSRVLEPAELLILAPDDNPEIYEGLGEVLIVPGFRSLNNSSDDIILRNADGLIIFELSYPESEQGKSAELVNSNDPCISENSYRISTAASGSTPGQQNSVFDDTADSESPEVLSWNFDQSLTVNFSETMDALSLMSGSYEISNLSISDISVGEFPTSVDIFFAESLDEGVIYQMNISNVTDCWGNALTSTMVNFGVGRAPTFNEILITEILSDPDPSAGLPEVEFVELYNNTSEILSIENLMFSDPTSSSELPEILLFPFEYYVLTSTSNVSKFLSAKVIGVSDFPSLSNSGEQLYLSHDEELIFSVSYSSDWHDEKRSEGGYSLEMRDILSPCVEEFNWVSSVDNDGGSPGSPNSVSQSIPDNFGPVVSSAVALTASELRVDFNENIDPRVAAIGTISFEPSINVASVNFHFLFPKSIFVSLGENLKESTSYSFQLINVTDCNGNLVQENNLIVALPSTAGTGDILLSEVLFNPRTGGVDFVELHNASAKYIDLNEWQLARVTDAGISDEKVISQNTLIISPGDHFAFTTDVTILFDNYPQGTIENIYEVASLPTYANDSGNVVLLNHLSELEEIFHYENDFHYDLLESTDGVSLERISFEADVNDPNNWRSASSVAGFATPGSPNSQAILSQVVAAGAVEVEPKVFVPGNSGSGRDFTTIKYQFHDPGKFANITIYDQTGRLIKNVAEGALLSTEGFVRWDGTTNSGEMARLGYYVVLFEVFDSNGNSDVIKDTIVVGRDF